MKKGIKMNLLWSVMVACLLMLGGGAGLLLPANAVAGKLGVGAAITMYTPPHKGADTGFSGGLFFFYQGERLELGFFENSYALIRTPRYALKLTANPRFESLDPSDSPALSGMEDRDLAFDAGLAFETGGIWGSMQIKVLSDITGTHEGQEISLFYTRPFVKARWRIEPTAGLILKSDNLVDYYYGVRSSEAREDRPAYQGQSTINSHLGLNLIYGATRHWNVIAGLSYEHLGGKIRNSPVIEKNYLATTDEPLKFFYGPLTYLYVRTMTSPENSTFTGKQWLHFLPFLLSIIILSPLFFRDDSQRVQFFEDEINSEDLQIILCAFVLFINSFLSMVSISVYFGISIRKMIRHARDINNQFSFTDHIKLNWLRNLLICLCLLYLVYIFGMLFSDSFGIDEEVENALYLMIVVVIYTMGYMGLFQPAIFIRLDNPQNQEGNVKENTTPYLAKEKYSKSALNTEMGDALLNELETYMDKEKPYQDCTLTLPQLAKQLGLPQHYLSQVINERLNKFFFDFINNYRVEEAKRYLTDSSMDKENILNIAICAGFNSKSVFYKAFKKYTNMTPGQYKKSLSPQ